MLLGTSERLTYQPLTVVHARPLHVAIADPRVYAHLGETPPSLEALRVDFESREQGPPPDRPGERWFNLAVALKPSSGPAEESVYIGRLEATLYGDWGEVAYLFGPAYWGQGYATEAMAWFHDELSRAGARVLWAAVTPTNARSLALLHRLGYRELPAAVAPPLGSYDPGDVCLCREFVFAAETRRESGT